jgi:multiple sugar transport system ATP-binding protein
MEPLGNEVFLDVKAGEDALIARADPTTKAKPNMNLSLKPSMENMHLFDIRDERALL